MRVAGSRDRPSSPTAGTPLADHSYGALSEHSCGALPEHSCGDCHQRVMVPVSADSRGPRERSRVRGALPVSYRGFLTGTASVAAEEQELQQNSLGSGRAEIYSGVDPSTRSPSGHPRVQPAPGGRAEQCCDSRSRYRDRGLRPGPGHRPRHRCNRRPRRSPPPRRHDRTGQDRIGHRSLASAGDCSRVNATRRWGRGSGRADTRTAHVRHCAGRCSKSPATSPRATDCLRWRYGVRIRSGAYPRLAPDRISASRAISPRLHAHFPLRARGFGSGRLHSRHTRHSRLRHVSAVAGVTVESSTST